jgi:putative ABC transport system permease protein
MLWIAVHTLRARKAGAYGALAAVALAATLAVSCAILLQSSLRTPIPVERLGAAGVVVQAGQSTSGDGEVSVSLPEPARLPAGVADRLRGVPGVRAVVADRSFDVLLGAGTAHVRGAPETIAGYGWGSAALTPYALAAGHAPRTATEVVVGDRLARRAALRPGAVLDVVTASARRRVTVAGIATPRSARDAAGLGSTLFFRDDVAAALSGSGMRADLIGLVLVPGADPAQVARRVRALLGRGPRVLTGARRGDAESPAAALAREDVVAGLTVFAVIAAFVAAFVVASTFALSVRQRHRELALLRAVGATPRQVRRMIAGEALLVALAATVVATPIGIAAARLEQGLFTRAGMLPDGFHLVVGWLPLAASVMAAVVTTQLAAFASARRASRIRPTDALREARVSRRVITWPRALLGLAAAAGGLAVLLLAGGGREGSAPAAAGVWMVAAALLGPLLAWPFTALIGAALGALGRGPGRLAQANARADLRRVAAVATPIMLAIALVCTVVYGKTLLQRQTTRQTVERTTAANVLTGAGGTGVAPDTAARARRVPGVTAASATLATSVLLAADGADLGVFAARGIDPASLPAVLDLGVTSGSIANVGDGAVALSTDVATMLRRHTGDRVELRLGDGTRLTPRVAAIYRRPLGFGDVLLARGTVLAHVAHALDETVFVANRPGVEAVVQARLGRLDPGLEVRARSQYGRAIEAAGAQESLAIHVLLGLVVVFCALALVNAVAMSTSERSRELALLRLVGAERRQLRAMIRGETLIMVAFGIVVGSLIAVPGLVVVSDGLTGSALPSVPLSLWASLAGGYAVVAFAATAIPMRLACRVDPVSALAARE